MCTALTATPMLCVKPFRPRPGIEHGCGQCLACRINRRRVWVARIMLESFSYPLPSAFVTLTYEESYVPRTQEQWEGDWRSLSNGCGFRYFASAELGERTKRPHFHVVCFGVPAESAECWFRAHWTRREATGAMGPSRSHLMRSAGFLDVRSLVPEHAAYVAGYTLKKLEQSDGDGGFTPFVRMSRRPGIGIKGLRPIINWLGSVQGTAFLKDQHDVPNYIGISRKIYPLGRTMVSALRDAFGIDPSSVERWQVREAQRIARIPELEDPTRLMKRHRAYDSLKRRQNSRDLSRRI